MREEVRDVSEPVAVGAGEVRPIVDRVHLVDPDTVESIGRRFDRVQDTGRLTVGERDDQLGSRPDVVQDVGGFVGRLHTSDATGARDPVVRSLLVTDTERVPAASVPVRPAATVMLVRDGAEGIEVFMLRRTLSAAFARGQYVFPGGKVDDADHGEALEPVCDGHDDASASARLGVASGGLAWLVAAIRECFEEAGVLLARHRDREEIIAFDDMAVAERFNRARHAIHAGERSLSDLCSDEGVLLLADRMHLVDHWVTPVGERRRFDTRFFLAAAPGSQEPLHDDKETIASLWVRPADALAMWRAGDLQMFPPTVASIEFLLPHSTVDAAMAAAEAVGVPPVVLPRIVLDDAGRVVGIRRPGDPDFDTTPLPEFVVEFPR